MRKGMAVVLREGALGRGTNMAEDETGGGLGGDTLQIGAVPGRDGRGEETRSWTKLRVGVKAYSEAIGIVLASSGVLLKWNKS